MAIDEQNIPAAMAGETRIRQVLAGAGCTRIRPVAAGAAPFNIVLEARP